MNEQCPIRKILFAADGSNLSMEAARFAAGLARCTRAQVTIITAVEATGVTEFVPFAVESNEENVEQLQETGTDLLEKTKQPFLAADVPVHAEIVEGPAADAIIDEAKDGDYDILIVGSTGTHRSLSPRLGEVAERVALNAPCPVLLFRS